jgi:23S rRNA pseudouridine2605 synthase
VDAHKRPLKTLERVISKAGLGSRSEARRWIHAGRVTINGQVTQNPDEWVDMERDRVAFDGAPLEARERLYLLLYKPTGYITTYKDPEGRPTVYDLIADVKTFVSPVGRLDLDTSGLLLLTNDNQLAERVTNPESHLPKTYLVKASKVLSDAQLQQLREGITLSDGPTRPAVVMRLRDSAKYTHLEITITEGRNRQVRRMIEALDAKVLKLVRVQLGDIRIDTLPIGKWRHLTAVELTALGVALPRVEPPPATRTSRPARGASPHRRDGRPASPAQPSRDRHRRRSR